MDQQFIELVESLEILIAGKNISNDLFSCLYNQSF